MLVDQKTLWNALNAGRLVATYTGDPNGHITVAFKGWKRGRGRRITPLVEADRVYVSDPTRQWGEGGHNIGHIELHGPQAGMLLEARNADPKRVAAARAILRAARGQEPTNDILPSTYCFRCGKPLTDPVSIERHIGPDCFGKITGSKAAPFEEFTWPEVKITAEPGSMDDYMNVAASNDRIDFEAGQFTVHFSYDPAKVADLKANVPQRSWDKLHKQWKVAHNNMTVDPLRRFAERNNLPITDKAEQAMQNAPQQAIGTIDFKDNVFVVYTLYDPDLVADIKTIPTRMRKWDRTTKRWHVTPGDESAKGLHLLIDKWGVQITDRARLTLLNYKYDERIA